MKSCRFALLLLAVFGSALSQTPLVQMQTYLMASATGPVIAWQVCVPIEPVDVQAIATAKAAAQFSEAYLKSAVHQCASYAEWGRGNGVGVQLLDKSHHGQPAAGSP